AGTSYQPRGFSDLSPVGTNPPNPDNATPYRDDGNPNHNHSGTFNDVSDICVDQPGFIPSSLITDLQRIFTTGVGGTTIGAGCAGKLGGVHADAIGYITIDVVNTCTFSFPGPTTSGETYSSQYLLF